MKKVFFLQTGLLLFTVFSCTKVPNGFLSDTMRYTSPDLYCLRGLALVQSAKIYADGSTPPYKFEMVNLRDSSGNKLPEAFNTKYDILVFKEGMTFNVETDTTVELLNQKRETISVEPMDFNTTSGQLTFNKASVNIPLGIYNFDVIASNRTGTKYFSNMGRIHVIDPSIDDLFELTYSAATGSDVAEVFTTIKAPKVSVKKISDEGARVILKYTDKNGKAWNPSKGEIIKRGDRPMFETHAKFNPVQYTDTAMICDFEVAPFPLQKYITPDTDWGYLMYYRIPREFVAIDGLPNQSANPVVGFQLKMEGTYVVEVQMTDATVK